MPIVSISAEEVAERIAADIEKRSTSRRRGGYLFVLGAGASYSCDIPLAKEMVNDLTGILIDRGWNEPEERDDKVPDYQWVMSKFPEQEQVDIIRDYIKRARVTDGRWKLNHCYLVLSEIWKSYPQYPRVLLTANFDPLFYYALLEQNIEAKLIRYFNEVNSMQAFDTEKFPSIIHLHGYWQNHFLYNTLQHFETYSEGWINSLVGQIMPFGLVVIGYAGNPAEILMQTLSRARDQYVRIIGNIYWCHLKNTQISNKTRVELDKLGNVVTVPIQDADSFMLQIGEALRLPEIKKISAFASVIEEQPPGFIWLFYNSATVTVDAETLPITIRIQTDSYHVKPGENYAGIDIYTVKRLFDLSHYSQVTVEYDATLSEGKGGGSHEFEFKLQSARAAHIENIPIGLNQKISLPLSLYSDDGVDLAAVDRIVIAANCEQIGCDSTLEIKLKRISWS